MQGDNLFARRDAKPLQEQLDRLQNEAAARQRGKEWRRTAHREREATGDDASDISGQRRKRSRGRKDEDGGPPPIEQVSEAESPETHSAAHCRRAAFSALHTALCSGASAVELHAAYRAAKALGPAGDTAWGDVAVRAEVRLLEIEIEAATAERDRLQKEKQLEKRRAPQKVPRASRRCGLCFITFSSAMELEAHACFALPSDEQQCTGMAIDVAAFSDPGVAALCEDPSIAQGVAPSGVGECGDLALTQPAAAITPTPAAPSSTLPELWLLGAEYGSEEEEEEEG